SSRRRHTRSKRDWSSDVCSSDLIKIRQRRGGIPLLLTDEGGVLLGVQPVQALEGAVVGLFLHPGQHLAAAHAAQIAVGPAGKLQLPLGVDKVVGDFLAVSAMLDA